MTHLRFSPYSSAVCALLSIALVSGSWLQGADAAATKNAKGEFTRARDAFQCFKDRYKGDNSVMDCTLLLVNKRGEKRKHHLLRYRKRDRDLVSLLLFYVSPPDVKGVATLSVEQPVGDDRQRIYLPAMKKHRRIAVSDKGKSWMGTDLSYEDLQERKADDYHYTSMRNGTFKGNDCYYFNMVPKNPSNSGYGRLEYWIQKDNRELVQGRYYDHKDNLKKVMNMGHFILTPDAKKKRKIHSATWMTMYNVKDKHRTVLMTNRVIYNGGVAGQTFSNRFMSRLPKRFKGGVVHTSRAKDYMFDPQPLINLPDPYKTGKWPLLKDDTSAAGAGTGKRRG